MSVVETVVKPTKEQIEDAREKMLTFFQEDFKNKVNSHLEAGHKFMFGKSLWRLTETHPEIIKEYGIYILMGTNRRHEDWGNMKDDFGLEPVRNELTPILVSMAREVSADYYYKILFTDKPKNDGNFKLKVDFNKFNKTNNKTNDGSDSEGFKPVKKSYKPKNAAVATPSNDMDKELQALKKQLAVAKAQYALEKENNRNLSIKLNTVKK